MSLKQMLHKHIHIALFEPEIPPNTGNIIRLCANCGAQLHLIHPLGFKLEEKSLRRAGLDYREWVDIKEYESFDAFKKTFQSGRIFACTTKATKLHIECQFKAGDCLLMGPESRGLPQTIRDELGKEQQIKLPMLENSRSLNLSNATAILCYEMWRQLDFQIPSHPI